MPGMAQFPDLSRLTEREKDALVLTLWAELQAGRRQIEALTAQVAALEARLSEPPKTPRNSSTPPSRGAKANRPQGGMRRRQGRPGVARTLTAEPDRVVEAVAETCPHCAAALRAPDQTRRAVYDRIEIPPIKPMVTRVHLFGGTCPCCGANFTAPVPSGLEPGSPYGRSVEALAVYFRYAHALGYARLSALLRDVFGVTVSEGALANLLARAAGPFAAQAAAIRAHVLAQPVIGSDETTARVAGRTWWEWVLVGGDRAVLHVIEPSRARRVLSELLGGVRPGVWVSDLYGAQRGHGEAWQVCLAHQLRDVQYAIDAGDAIFAPRLKRVLVRAVAIGRRRDRLRDGTLRQYAYDLDRRLDRVMARAPTNRHGQRLRRRIARIRPHLFVFVTDRAVPSTNNACERALRPSVIFRKVTGGFRSPWGARLCATIRSVIDTGRLNGLTPLQAIGTTLAGQPLLRPA